MVAARQASIKSKKAAAEPAASEPADEQGSAPAQPAAPAAPAPALDADDDDDDDEDIEASIERELAALKAGRGSGKMAPGRSTAGGSGGAATTEGQDKGKNKERPRFQSIATDTECRASLLSRVLRRTGGTCADDPSGAVCFIATAWPYDPVELTEALVAEVQETGQSRTRYVTFSAGWAPAARLTTPTRVPALCSVSRRRPSRVTRCRSSRSSCSLRSSSRRALRRGLPPTTRRA